MASVGCRTCNTGRVLCDTKCRKYNTGCCKCDTMCRKCNTIQGVATVTPCVASVIQYRVSESVTQDVRGDPNVLQEL